MSSLLAPHFILYYVSLLAPHFILYDVSVESACYTLVATVAVWAYDVAAAAHGGGCGKANKN